MVQTQTLISDPHNGYLGSFEIIISFVNDSRLNRAREVAREVHVVSLSSSLHDKSTKMQHDLFRSSCNIGLSQILA